MKLLLVGDIVGSPGRAAFEKVVGRMRADAKADFVVVNGENAAAGRGITPALADELFRAGADAMTLGDHTWDQKDLLKSIDKETRIVRPANFSPKSPGRGWQTFDSPAGSVTVINLIGRVFMQPNYDCPFRTADSILGKKSEMAKIIVVDMHAEATSEKIAMGRYLDGRVSAVVGTHTHVQTSDETILPGGTAYLTDLGMTGPKDSVLGREVEPVLNRFLTGMPTRFGVAKNDICLEGLIVEVDEQSGQATSVERIRERAD